MKLLESEKDFKWYKNKLDVDRKYEYEHNGTPKEYPCKVSSEWGDNDNGPYYYWHSFIYQEEVVCSACSHKELKWPDDKAIEEVID